MRYTLKLEANRKKIPAEIADRLPAKLLAKLGDVMREQYYAGRTSVGAEHTESGMIWVDALERGFGIEVLERLPK